MENDALDIYRKLILIRRCQEKIIAEYPKDEIKTPVHLGIGLEGIAVGVTHVMPRNAKSFGQLRNHGQYLALTGETDAYFGELYGKVTGTGAGKAGSMHLCSPEHGLISTSGIVAATVPLAVGAALAAKYRGSDELALAMFGDAAVEEGEYWDCFNFACLHKLRVLLVCEDNDLSIHTSGAERRGHKSIAGVMRGFDCHVFEGDGTDVRAVMALTRTALAAMEREPWPGFLCLKWFRFLEHVGPNTDFHVGYRPRPDEETLRGHCFADMENTVLHEAYPGHHLQLVYAKGVASKIRRCAEAPTLAEGWGLYAEELGHETGYYSGPEARLLALNWRLHRAARVILDVSLHARRLPFEEAVTFLVERVHLQRPQAVASVNSYTLRPTYFMSYLVGMREIMRVREAARARWGAGFTLRRFHEAVLAAGSIPVGLLASAFP